MNTGIFFRRITLLGLLFFSVQSVMAVPKTLEDEIIDTVNYSVYYGRVIDKSNSNALPFAAVEAIGSNMATVTNIDGNFILKIPREADVTQIKVSYVGYGNITIPIQDFKKQSTLTIGLEPTPVQLKEITVRPEDALHVIMDALRNVGQNYSIDPMMMRGFYRETIVRNWNYVAISEAIVDIYKAPYENDFQVDQVKIFKGRKSADVEKMDTVLFKLRGGPSTALLLDVVKNPYILLTDQYAEIYNFHLSDIISINDKLHYVVSFFQKEYIDDPYYDGRFYVDMDKLGITEVEFELNTENKEVASRMFIQKKPIGMIVEPEKAVYRAKYTISDNKWYFSYARAEVKFKVKWDKKLFNTTYTTMSELAITDRSSESVEKFSSKDRFRSTDILDEKVYVFFEQDFWGSYNVIEPDQSIESAIRRLNRKYLRRNG
ncbi:MAG: carboxypeptidase-like regulatory domain-containing protein [Bacteroidales bacterium]|nr:carboxypeptidase-like regulatory domain-containing protein [Bacteroidales bacterium]MBN2698213.1 carboxypeptidase-like regulatory domain-containing protein [Bacteroidales bacterium]